VQFSKHKDVKLVAIVEPNPTEDINSLDVPCFSNLKEMFAAISPDGIILSTPTPLHVSQGLECIERSCPVLVEKPLATSAVQAKILTDAAEHASVPLLVGHHRRHNPLIQKAKGINS
jgi:predicted dehydrogenase